MSIISEHQESIKLANLGNHAEMVKVAIDYVEGEVVSKNIDEAEYWLKEAENTDDPYLLTLLGEYCEYGIVFNKDLRRAVKNYKNARRISRVFSYPLGRFYLNNSMGSESRNKKLAMNYFIESAKLQHVPSIASINYLLRSGYFGFVCKLLSYISYPIIYIVILILYRFSKDSYRFWKLDEVLRKGKGKGVRKKGSEPL